MNQETYTVVGLWLGDEAIVAGVIEGSHAAVDSDPNDYRFNGRWMTSVEAWGPEEAESTAVAEMEGTLVELDDDQEEENHGV